MVVSDRAPQWWVGSWALWGSMWLTAVEWLKLQALLGKYSQKATKWLLCSVYRKLSAEKSAFNLDPSGLCCFFPFFFLQQRDLLKDTCDYFNLLGRQGFVSPACWRAEGKTALVLIVSHLRTELIVQGAGYPGHRIWEEGKGVWLRTLGLKEWVVPAGKWSLPVTSSQHVNPWKLWWTLSLGSKHRNQTHTFWMFHVAPTSRYWVMSLE